VTTFYADRSDRGKLRFSGPQDRWFLHQILTQAFEDMRPGEARDAALITAHGRMVGYLEVLATEDGLLAHFEPELKDTLPDAIRRYVFATQVEIEDVSDEWSLLLIGGDGPDQVIADLDHVHLHPTSALGVPASYIWTRAPKDVIAAVRATGAEEASEEQLEAIRIENGVARWARDMDEKTFPQEAGIESRAVHFDKGCYVGQEAMAKIHFRGKVNRRLARITSDQPVQPGAELALDGQRVGIVTSSIGHKGLAMVRYTVEPGTTLQANEREVSVVG
jgi:folate-binding protein YgfZ